MFNPELCRGCPLDGVYQPLEARGPEGARFLILTDIPSVASATHNRLMTATQMKLLGAKLIDAGFESKDFRFTTACHCAYDPNEHVQKDKTAALKHCRQHFLEEVESHDYELVIPLGATAATQAFGRATKITRVRGLVSNSDELGVPIFPLMAPGQVVMYPQNEPVFDADIASLARSVDAGYDASLAASQQIGEYEIIDDLQFLIDMNPEVVSFDLEATGLRWYKTGVDVRLYRKELHEGKSFFAPRFQILTMQFSVEAGKAYVLVWDHPENPISEERRPILRNQLRQLLCKEDRIVIGQHTKIDCVWLWMTEGIRFRIGGDTLMLATLIDENMPEKSLDTLVKVYVAAMSGYADQFNATTDKSRMWEVPIAKLLPYSGGDADAAFRLYHVLEAKVMEDEKLWANYCHVVIPGLNAFAAMETRGMHVDAAGALADFKTLMIEDVARMETELLHAIPRACKQDIVKSFLSKANSKGQLVNSRKTAADVLSFTRPDFVKEVLFTNRYGFKLKPKVFTKTTAKLNDLALREPSTSAKDHLPYFFDECPFTESLAEFQKDRHLLNTSVVKFEENYIRGGKVRPTYNMHTAVTGRTSSVDPNGQNYPKRGERATAYRKMFVPPPGHFVIEADLNQAELRIVACMSRDKTMIGIYQRGEDIHKETALIAANTTQAKFDLLPKAEKKSLRQKAKSINFGLIYGMWWKRLVSYAKTSYGVDFTDPEAKRIYQGYFAKYRSIAPWHARMREFAREHKFVRSYSGRVRHLPMIDSSEDYIQQEAERQAINSPVQNLGSDLGVMTLGRLNEEIDPEALQIVGFIHDAIVAYVPCAYLDWGMKTLKWYMETNPIEEWFGHRLPVPIVSDVSFGINLGEMFECEGFDLEDTFNYASLVDEEGNPLVDVPPQKTPPNEGRLTRSAYTTPEDLEDESTPAPQFRFRLMRASTKETAKKCAKLAVKKVSVVVRRLRSVR